MLKRVLGLCLAFCMVFTLMVPGYAQAKESSISSDTIITEDNIYEVLEYLGIDSSIFVKADTVTGVSTVGELEKSISQAKNLPRTVNYTLDSTNTPEDTKDYRLAASGTVGLSSDYEGDSYTVTYGCSGQFSNDKWTGVTGTTISIDTDHEVFVYKIAPGPQLSATYTSTTITMKAKYTVEIYVSVFGMGLVKTGTQNIDATIKWFASTDIPK
ncbi:MAG: hypothetical protein K0R50_2560 [Eubacterium sp.]|jgi:hypothetical protein|nr:hypothetical protein [Eubacterium sp.]